LKLNRKELEERILQLEKEKERKRVVAFIDFENINKTATEQGKVIDYEKLIEMIRGYGEVIFADIYIPENYFSFIERTQVNLNLLGFRIICCKKMTEGSNKTEDTVDINLIKDGMKILELFQNLTHFVIIGHDKHMIHLATEAQNRGKELVIIGTEKISHLLKRVVERSKIQRLPVKNNGLG